MTTSPNLSLLFFLVFWVTYFLIIFFVGTRWYYKLRGTPPGSTAGLVIVNGKPVSALAAWQEKERRLKRRFLWGGLALAFSPLFVPILARLFS